MGLGFENFDETALAILLYELANFGDGEAKLHADFMESDIFALTSPHQVHPLVLLNATTELRQAWQIAPVEVARQQMQVK